MSYINPVWLEGQRRRWLRHDAHRFAAPGSDARKSYAARLVEQRRAEEKQSVAAQQDALRDDLERLRWLVKDLKIDLALRRLKYSPDQPRDERGRWTDAGATDSSSQSTDGNEQAVAGSEPVRSDASPDPILPGAQYARTSQWEVYPVLK